MKITEWFARLVAAGLIPTKWDNIETIYKPSKGWVIYNNHPNDSDVIVVKHKVGQGKDYCIIQLRKDGKDLYSLEWRKPTSEDIGKMCWFYDNNKDIVLLSEIRQYWSLSNTFQPEKFCFEEDQFSYYYCLLADHGQIAPTEDDFKQVYGE